ncbi:MAG: hypothetical protein EXR47_04445 [Dehalococcoidia bacterium]|nr:hypothetical protein [Dehalococcoidia bacterium]
MRRRPVTILCQSLRLRGEITLPEGPGPFPGVVICHPHPLRGGDMDNNVVMGVNEALLQHGIATLRFSFRSAGGSEGVHDNGVEEVDDALSALRLLATTEGVDTAKLGLVGYSFGAGVALRAAQGSHLCPLPLGEGKGEGETSLKSKVAVAPARGFTVRAVAAIGCPPRALAALDGAPSLPMLFVAGERDHIAAPDQLLPIVARLPQPADLVAIPRADHFFDGHESIVGNHVADFFAIWLGNKDTRDP